MADTDKYILYHYNPSLAAAIIFIALFGLLTATHCTQLLLKRTWYFIPFVIGGLCKYTTPESTHRQFSNVLIRCLSTVETMGYVGRALSATQSPNWTVPPYVMQSLLILLAPALFAASIYMVLGRIICLTDGKAHSVIRVNWITKIFVTGDVLSFLAQSAGMLQSHFLCFFCIIPSHLHSYANFLTQAAACSGRPKPNPMSTWASTSS
jgi:hypothetical protein